MFNLTHDLAHDVALHDLDLTLLLVLFRVGELFSYSVGVGLLNPMLRDIQLYIYKKKTRQIVSKATEVLSR